MIDTAYVYTPSLPADEIGPLLTELSSLGIDTIILSETRQKSVDCSTNSYIWTSGNPSRVGAYLDAAQARGMHVYVGLVFSAGVCATFDTEPNITQDHDDTAATVVTLVGLYGDHSALRGWSIVNEAALAYHTDATILSQHHDYYAAQVAAIRVNSDLPIITAPYLGGVYNAWNGSVQTPAQVAAKALAFQAATGVDVQVWQDSAASDLVMYEWTRQTYKLGDYYAALIAALGAGGIWSDNELFTYASPQFTGPGYQPAAVARIAHSLEVSAGAGRQAAFLPQSHMSEVASAQTATAPRLLAAYRGWYGQAGDYVDPADYTWVTPPLVGQPDTGQLFDRATGDPLNASDASWVGIAANPVLVVDMGSTETVRWVGAHVLHLTSAGVAFPDSLTVETSPDGSTWTSEGTWPLAFTKSDGEYVICNTTALDVSCRYLRLSLANASKTHISEIEVVVEGVAETGVNASVSLRQPMSVATPRMRVA